MNSTNEAFFSTDGESSAGSGYQEGEELLANKLEATFSSVEYALKVYLNLTSPFLT
jgi:hypothetical protein